MIVRMVILTMMTMTIIVMMVVMMMMMMMMVMMLMIEIQIWVGLFWCDGCSYLILRGLGFWVMSRHVTALWYYSNLWPPLLQ